MSMVAMKQPYLLQVMYDNDPLNPRTDYNNLGRMVCWHSRYNLGDEHHFNDPNDFLQDLAQRAVSEYDLFEFVHSGKAPTTKLTYDHSQNGWEIDSYDDYFKKWYHDNFFEGSLEENKSAVKDCLIETISNKELLAVAREKNIILPLNLYDHSELSMSISSFIGHTHYAEWDSGHVGWIYATADRIRSEFGNCSAENMKKAKAFLKAEVKTYNYYLSGQCYGFRLYENGEETESRWGFLGAFQDVIKAIAREVLPESHWDMVEHFYEVSDTVTREKGYNDFMEDLEKMEE